MRSINLGRWSRYVERYFNIKGGGGLMDVEQAIRLNLPFQSGVEDRYLQGWNRFAVFASQAAVAAQFTRFRIRNPTGSNVIMVLEQLQVYTLGAADSPFVTWGAATGDLATLVSLSFSRMDPRGNPQPTAIVSTTTSASTTGQAFLQRVLPLSTNVDYISGSDQQIPVLPGNVVDMDAQVVNNALNISVMWRERALEASELT